MKGKDIRKARKLMGMTLKVFAKEMGLRGKYSERTVRRWEKDEFRPSVAAVDKIKFMLEQRGY